MLLLVLLAFLVVSVALNRRKIAHPPHGYYPSVTPEAERVALLIAAHNSEDRIVAVLNSAARVVSVSNIFLVSDDSTDRTAELARSYGVRVVETFGRQGPAGAIESGVQAFRLLEEFPYVLLVDVDTRLDPHHLERVLPLFADESVAAVGVPVDMDWRTYRRGPLAALLTAYRARSYALPGRARTLPSVARTYRSSVLGKLELNPANLAIADFDLTNQLRRRDLGRVVVCPDVVARTAAPTRLAAYRAQNRLWHTGFWQAVRRNGGRPLGTVAELLASGLVFALAPLIALLAIPWPLTAVAIAGTIAGADYLLTIAVAVARRQPRFLLPGLLFPVLRVLDAVSVLAALTRSQPDEPGRAWLGSMDDRPSEPEPETTVRVVESARRRNPLLAALGWLLCAVAAGIAVIRVALTTATLPPATTETALVDAAYRPGPPLGDGLGFTELQLRGYTAVTSAFGRHANVLQAARELSVGCTVVIMLGMLAVAAILRVHPMVATLGVCLLAVSRPAIGVLTPVLPGVPAAAWLTVAAAATVAALAWLDHRWLTFAAITLTVAATALLAALVTAPILIVPVGAGMAAWIARRSTIAAAGVLALTTAVAAGLWQAGLLLDDSGAGALDPRQRLLVLGLAGAAAAAGLFARWLRPVAVGIGVGVVLAAAAGPRADALLPALVFASALLIAVMLEDALDVRLAGGLARAGRVAAGLAAAVGVCGAAAGLALAPRSWTPPDHAGLAAWAVENLDGDVRLVAPAGLRADLERDLARAGRTVRTETPEQLLVAIGPDRPAGIQLASFGSIAVLLPGSSDGYLSPDTRLGPGTQLATNPRLRGSAEVLAAIGAGRLDLRAMALLAAMCREHVITIAEVGNPAHERGFPQPDRILVLSEVDGQPVTDAARAAPLLAWLRAQEPPFAPADIRVTPAGVRVAWRLPARLDQPLF